MLSVLSDRAGQLTPEDAERIDRVAAQVAVAVANARLYERVEGQVEELRLLNADLAEANKHKSVFLATMSHELRTPLNAIIGFAELLLDDIITEAEERRESLIDILRSGQHLLTLINDVLDLTKVEAGQMTLAPRPLDLRHELASIDRIMSPLFAQRLQRYTYSVPPDFPPVFADASRMRQVILNVLSNANKFTPDGGTITLTASVGNGNREARIAVADTGIGIKAEDIPLVWQEFRQIDTSISRKYEGTGLGLTLTRRLLALMHGRIWLESAYGSGHDLLHRAAARGRSGDLMPRFQPPEAQAGRTARSQIPADRDRPLRRAAAARADSGGAGVQRGRLLPVPRDIGARLAARARLHPRPLAGHHPGERRLLPHHARQRRGRAENLDRRPAQSRPLPRPLPRRRCRGAPGADGRLPSDDPRPRR